MTSVDRPSFIIDQNVGKLAKLLRLLGYDAVFFSGGADAQMVAIALAENRVILTRDTHVLERSPVTRGKIKAVLIRTDDPNSQIRQVIGAFDLLSAARELTLCLECNVALVPRDKASLEGKVPPHVFETHDNFRQCPRCERIYWPGTHWAAMKKRLEELRQPGEKV